MSHKHKWRDMGGGQIECKPGCGQVAEFKSVRQNNGGEELMMVFTPEEWAKLERLAKLRSTRKKTFTPEECVREFISACVTEPGWVHPTDGSA